MLTKPTLIIVIVCFLWANSAFPQGQMLTAWGHPDLQGIWDRRTITPLQRPPQFANLAFLSEQQVAEYEQRGRERADGRPPDSLRTEPSVHAPDLLDYGSTVVATRQTSLIIEPANGKIPAFTEVALARRISANAIKDLRGSADSWEDRSLFERCITRGLPAGMLPGPYNNNLQIIQTPNSVIISNEMIHHTRVIPLDGRPHIAAKLRQWMGDSRGYWDGDTLVVDTTNFSAKSEFRGSSDNLHLTERFTRIGDDMISYQFTVADSSTWIRPWTVSFPMKRTEGPIYEYACHEGNYGLRNILSIARNLDKIESGVTSETKSH